MPVVLVTHDLDEAALLADRLCLLHRGRTLQIGAPTEVMARPESVAVARLVDVPNILEGRIAAHRAEAGVTLIAWGPHTLEARLDTRFAPGAAVAWCIPAGAFCFIAATVRRVASARTPSAAWCAEFVPLGENASVRLAVDGFPDRSLFLTVPLPVARRNGIEAGQRFAGREFRRSPLEGLLPAQTLADEVLDLVAQLSFEVRGVALFDG